MILDLAKKVIRNSLKGKQTFFELDYQKQKEILNKFNQPLDLLERSYFQYLCQIKQLPLIIHLLFSFISIFIIPYFYVKYRVNTENKINNNINIAIFISGGVDSNYIPQSLKKEFTQIIYSDYNDNAILTKEDKKILKLVFKRYWFSPYFFVKVMIKIAYYSYQINTYDPEAIITSAEYSYTSSALTFYCLEKNIEHINIMHGEKLLNIRDSFVKFDRYYVWDKHYKNLLLNLRAGKEQFRIEKPDILKFNLDKNISNKYILTYYLGGESKIDLKNIKNNLLKTNISPEKICIRMHPRYSNEQEVNNTFQNFNVENPNEITIKKSLTFTKYAVSLCSTVLYQAYLNDVEIIIDDISNRVKYNQLKELDYIMMKKDHHRLSEFV